MEAPGQQYYATNHSIREASAVTHGTKATRDTGRTLISVTRRSTGISHAVARLGI